MDQQNICRIIFLDIDGVLNSQEKLIEVYNKTHKPHSGYNYPFDEKCLSILKEIVLLTDSYIVITSSWRKDEEGRDTILNKLREYDLDNRLLGYTPILGTNRGKEIKAYLNSINMPVEYIIIDDDSDMDELIDYLIKTNIRNGLTNKEKDEAIKKFLRK